MCLDYLKNVGQTLVMQYFFNIFTAIKLIVDKDTFFRSESLELK